MILKTMEWQGIEPWAFRRPHWIMQSEHSTTELQPRLMSCYAWMGQFLVEPEGAFMTCLFGGLERVVPKMECENHPQIPSEEYV
jgi:hypothetical protein